LPTCAGLSSSIRRKPGAPSVRRIIPPSRFWNSVSFFHRWSFGLPPRSACRRAEGTYAAGKTSGF